MRTYIAHSGNLPSHIEGLFGCLTWAQGLVADNPRCIVKIHRARPGQSGSPVIAEVTADGCRWITCGRVAPTKKLQAGANG